MFVSCFIAQDLFRSIRQFWNQIWKKLRRTFSGLRRVYPWARARFYTTSSILASSEQDYRVPTSCLHLCYLVALGEVQYEQQVRYYYFQSVYSIKQNYFDFSRKNLWKKSQNSFGFEWFMSKQRANSLAVLVFVVFRRHAMHGVISPLFVCDSPPQRRIYIKSHKT